MKLILGTMCLVMILEQLNAQTSGVFVNSNYGGVYSTQMNPANSSQLHHKWIVSLGSIDALISNDYMSINMPYHPIRLIFGNYPNSLKSANNNPLWRWSWLQTNSMRETVSLHGMFKVSGPSTVFKYKKHSFGLLTELNVFADMHGLPKSIADQMQDELKRGQKLQDDQPVYLEDIQNVLLNIKQQTWTSLGFNYSYLWTFKRRNTLSAGITYKLLHSMGGSQIMINAGGFNQEDNKSISFKSPGIAFTNMLPRKNTFYPRGLGGMDLGMVYQKKKSETGRWNNSKKRHPDYLYQLGVSILDIGSLVYTRTIKTELPSSSQTLTIPSVEELISWTPEKAKDELLKVVSQINEASPETIYGQKIRIGLPTRMVIHGNIQVNKHFYIDAVIQQNLRKRNGKNINTLSYLSFSPRWENKWFTLGMPLSLENNYRQPNIGLFVRVLWVYFGTKNIATIVSPNGKQNADIFMGIQFGNMPGKSFKGKSPYMFFRKRKCAEF
jgi:hypothetical protein